MLERVLGFVFTFINFRTGMFALVLYFLDRYFMVGNSCSILCAFLFLNGTVL